MIIKHCLEFEKLPSWFHRLAKSWEIALCTLPTFWLTWQTLPHMGWSWEKEETFKQTSIFTSFIYNLFWWYSVLQVYPAALRAQKRRQEEVKRKEQLREEAVKRKEKPAHFDADVAFPKTWWMTEYQRNFCKEEDIKRHFLRWKECCALESTALPWV